MDTRGVNEYHGKQREYGGYCVYELSAVVGLDNFDGKAELSVDIIAKNCNMCGDFRFVSEGKGPIEMSEIIK